MMRKIMVLASIIIVATATVSAHAAKAAKGSFLVSSVTTVDQLSQQVIDDATVAARYAKHYKMSRNAVVDYFQKSLRIGKLTKDYETTVYYIRDKADISLERRTLPAGSYVFVATDGTPVLEGRTGNPLGDSLPITMLNELTSTAGSTLESSLSSVDGTEALTSTDGGVVTKVLGVQPAELGAAAAGIGTVEPMVEIVSAMPVTSVPSAAIGAANLRLLIPAAAVLGGAAIAANSGGDNGRSPSPASVPEPGSLIALVLGASGIALPVLRRIRKS
ncbi:MAG: PEP-CTERM sorting domain-containing protein [Armatimonadota bacterium]